MISNLLFKKGFQRKIKPEVEEVILGQLLGHFFFLLVFFSNSDIAYLIHSFLVLTIKNPII